MYKPLIVGLLLSLQAMVAQNGSYSTALIPENLKENANSVVREEITTIQINAQKSYTIRYHLAVTVLNSKGNKNVDAVIHYNPSDRVKDVSVVIYNALGREIKKLKEGDLKDVSASGDGTLLSDDRVMYLEYTPTDYPYTVVFEYAQKSNNTAFLPEWRPINDFYESVQNSKIQFSYPPEVNLTYKTRNSEGLQLAEKVSPGNVELALTNLPAEKFEEYAPSISQLFPSARFALDKFNLEGVYGDAKSWADHGAWMYTTLLKDTEELPAETIEKMKVLVAGAKDDNEKARRIYEYMQNKTRYVSIQLGIGGWKPMLAKNVDKLGYGDCKALTNYTRALLKAVGVESYYTVIYSGAQKRDFSADFVTMQGNHIILALPQKDKKYFFLECTSQSIPFGFQGDFTDDRLALLIKPEGGELVRTNSYDEKLSAQYDSGTVQLHADHSITGSLVRKSTGIQYDNAVAKETKSKTDLIEDYKEEFSWINNLTVDKYKLTNDKNLVEFKEEVSISATDFVKENGGYITFNVNIFNQSISIPQRYRNRKYPFEIARGFYDVDEVEIVLPEGYKCEGIPAPIVVTDKFGDYALEMKEITPQKIKVKRTYFLKKGKFDKAEYENFRKFREQIARYDGTKLLLIKA